MTSIYDWSTTAASNASVGSINWAEGQLPSTVNNSARAEMADVAAWRDLLGAVKISATADTMTLTSGLSLSAYAQGLMFAFECGAANTGAVTINVDSLGAKAIVKRYNQPLVAGDLVAGGIYLIAYEATAGNFQLISPVSNDLGDEGILDLSANGAYFGTAAAANLLDDYEEGTWTPTIVGSTTPGSPTYSTQAGKYTKIGDMVFVQFRLKITAGGSIAGNLSIGGLPFTNSAYIGSAFIPWRSVVSLSSGEDMTGTINASATSISLQRLTATSVGTITEANIDDTDFELRGFAIYSV